MLFQRVEDRLDAGIHVGHCAIVLGIDIILVGDPFGHPRFEEVGKGLEVQHRLHRLVAFVGLVAVIKHALDRVRAADRASAGPCGAGRERRVSSL